MWSLINISSKLHTNDVNLLNMTSHLGIYDEMDLIIYA